MAEECEDFSSVLAEPRIKKNSMIFLISSIDCVDFKPTKGGSPIFFGNMARTVFKVLFNGVSCTIARSTDNVKIAYVICTTVI